MNLQVLLDYNSYYIRTVRKQVTSPGRYDPTLAVRAQIDRTYTETKNCVAAFNYCLNDGGSRGHWPRNRGSSL